MLCCDWNIQLLKGSILHGYWYREMALMPPAQFSMIVFRPLLIFCYIFLFWKCGFLLWWIFKIFDGIMIHVYVYMMQMMQCRALLPEHCGSSISDRLLIKSQKMFSCLLWVWAVIGGTLIQYWEMWYSISIPNNRSESNQCSSKLRFITSINEKESRYDIQ